MQVLADKNKGKNWWKSQNVRYIVKVLVFEMSKMHTVTFYIKLNTCRLSTKLSLNVKAPSFF